MSLSKLKITFGISVFISSTKLVFEIKELLNFQRPRPLEILLKFRKEKNYRGWSVDRAFSILTFLADSFILFEINKYSSLLCKIPEKWRCWNVNALDLGFLIHHLSRKLRDSVSSINFLTANVFHIGFPPADSKFWSKNKLNSPAKKFFFHFNLENILIPSIDSLKPLTVLVHYWSKG